MRASLRPLFVCGLSIAIAAMSLVGSSSVALAATKPTITSWPATLTVQEGDMPTISVTFTDPDGADSYSYNVSWGDGDSSSGTIPAPSTFQVTKSAPYALPPGVFGFGFQVTVTDTNPGLSSSRFGDVVVVNAPPSISSLALSPSALDAGQAATATGTIADPSVTDTHSVTVDWGDGTPTTTMSLGSATSFTTSAHTFNLVGDLTVTATVTDGAGATAVKTAGITVRAANQAPTAAPLEVVAGSEGSSSTLALAFTDPDALDTHTVSVAWGDGPPSAPVELAAGVFTFGASHVYVNNGTYAVVLTLSDSAGHTVPVPASVSPTNVAPVVGSLSLTPSSVVDHQTLTVSGSFTDPGTADTFTLTVDWGDSTSSTDATVTPAHPFSATHAYNAAGSFTISATVKDSDNDSGSSSVALVVLPSIPEPSAVLDDMSSLVLSFGLDRNTERWMLKRVDDVRDSLATGNSQVCSDAGTLSHLLAFAQRNLTSDEYAALNGLATKLEVAAGCVDPNVRPNGQPEKKIAARARSGGIQ